MQQTPEKKEKKPQVSKPKRIVNTDRNKRSRAMRATRRSKQTAIRKLRDSNIIQSQPWRRKPSRMRIVRRTQLRVERRMRYAQEPKER